MRRRSVLTSILDASFVLEEEEEEDSTDKWGLNLYPLTKKQNTNIILI